MRRASIVSPIGRVACRHVRWQRILATMNEPAPSKPSLPEVRAGHYQFAHGHRPRGRGSWAFAPHPSARIEQVFFVPGCLTYAEAKTAAREHFRGHPVIFPQT